MVFVMSIKTFIKRIIYVMAFILLLFLFRVNYNNSYYNKLYDKYIPDYKLKYDELLDSYDLLKETYTFIPVEVINSSFLNTNGLIIINKGKNSNIQNHSYVVDKDGLVGIVRKVFNNYSVVSLKTSNNISIPIEIDDCYGTLRNKNNKGYVNDLINCDSVKINDPVFTSKYSVSSSNILVGYVKKIESGKIYVDYVSNPYKLKFVGVIYDKY